MEEDRKSFTMCISGPYNRGYLDVAKENFESGRFAIGVMVGCVTTSKVSITPWPRIQAARQLFEEISVGVSR